ncbi:MULTISPECIES: hypothetical protein [Pseudofrankia]|uniref:hypothetical protein n=1 Tax=Pseudofrankia TaxID=2994363 RepID=UPI000234D56B|nr:MULTISPECIES: hypothetical protein [Pseudofrankia]OHV39062.1 hypothetical protein BCD49_12175 [Pseudofrankia sp. EUN1h]
MATSRAGAGDDVLGAAKASVIAIDIPVVVDIHRKRAPAVFDAAGVDVEPVTIPPDQGDLTPRARRTAADGTSHPSFTLFKTGGETYRLDIDIDIDTGSGVAIGMFTSMAGFRAARPPGQSPIEN